MEITTKSPTPSVGFDPISPDTLSAGRYTQFTNHCIGIYRLGAIPPRRVQNPTLTEGCRSSDKGILKRQLAKPNTLAMSLWHLYYHLVWATKNREPLITQAREELLYPDIRSRASRLKCITYAVGGTENHIHLILSIPPYLSITEVVKQLKGGSSYTLNQRIPIADKFYWQKEYGVFSLGRKQLDNAVKYVEHQKEHHAVGSIINIFEQTRN